MEVESHLGEDKVVGRSVGALKVEDVHLAGLIGLLVGESVHGGAGVAVHHVTIGEEMVGDIPLTLEVGGDAGDGGGVAIVL